jgi:DNA-directed RNA polymerase III subunit RPC3
MVNFERFHQDFRDILMMSAIERKLDNIAGECFKFMARENVRQVDALVSEKINYLQKVSEKNSVFYVKFSVLSKNGH